MSPASYRKPWETWPLAHIKEFWFAYVAIAQLIYTFWFTNFTLGDHEKRITETELSLKTQDTTLHSIETRLASIETSLKYIEQKITKL